MPGPEGSQGMTPGGSMARDKVHASQQEIPRLSYSFRYTSGTFSVSPSISRAWSTSFSSASSFPAFASGPAPSISLPTALGSLPLLCQRSIPERTRFIFRAGMPVKTLLEQ